MLIRYIGKYTPKLGDFYDTIVIDIENNKKWLFDPCGSFTEMNDAGTKQFVKTVDELETPGEENTLYILRGNDGFYLYVFVDGAYHKIGKTE